MPNIEQNWRLMIIGGLYVCKECGFKSLNKNMRICPICGKSTDESLNIGHVFLRVLSEHKEDILNANATNSERIKSRIIREVERFEIGHCINSSIIDYVLDRYDDLYDFYVRQVIDQKQKTIEIIRVKNLFGYHSYELSFNPLNKISVIYGTNGLGKTTIFKILKAIFLNNKLSSVTDKRETIKFLKNIRFDEFFIQFADGSSVTARKNNFLLDFSYRFANDEINIDDRDSYVINLEDTNMDIFHQFDEHVKRLSLINPYIYSENRVLFIPVNRSYDIDEMEEQLNSYYRSNGSTRKLTNSMRSSLMILNNNPEFIQKFKKRYDMAIRELTEIYQINPDLVNKARRISIEQIEYIIHSPLNNPIIEEISKQVKDSDFSHSTNLTLDRQVNRFTEYTSRLYRLAKGYNLFKETFEKFYYEYDPSKKVIDVEDGSIFLRAKSKLQGNDYNIRLDFASLSSGEKNLANIIFKVIFETRNDTLLLIDEPEISLHVEWQHQITDVIAELIKDKDNVQVFIASHSPFVASGREEIMVEPTLLIEENTNE